MTAPLLMTLREFAARYAVSERTMRRRVKEGVVPAIHANRRVYIPLAQGDKQYQEYLKERETEYRASRSVQQPAGVIRSALAERVMEIARRTGEDFTIQ